MFALISPSAFYKSLFSFCYKLLVINRGDEKTEVKDNVVVMDILNNDISSTFIRNNIDNDDIIKKYLDKNVLEYIRKEKLYEGCS